MSRTFHHGKRNNTEQRIRARGIKRSKPDLRHLGRALIELAEAELENKKSNLRASFEKTGLGWNKLHLVRYVGKKLHIIKEEIEYWRDVLAIPYQEYKQSRSGLLR